MSTFRFCLISIFSKKDPESCQFVTDCRKALFEFLTLQTGEMAFIIFNGIIIYQRYHYVSF